MITALRTPRPRDEAGALQAVLGGSVVTQTVARHWRGGASTCPRCERAAETWNHRFWECPEWRDIRQRVAGHWVPALHEVRATGILPQDEMLWRLREEAQARVLPAAPPTRMRVVWLDGSAIYPKDPLLRRAAWAVVWWTGQGWCATAGPVAGRQTSARAELAALVWAVEAAPDGVEARSDCQYVVRGALRLQQGAAGWLFEGRHGDLWCRLRHRVFTVVKVKAHRNLADVPPDDVVNWVANDLADGEAKRMAWMQAPPPRQRAAPSGCARRPSHGAYGPRTGGTCGGGG